MQCLHCGKEISGPKALCEECFEERKQKMSFAHVRNVTTDSSSSLRSVVGIFTELPPLFRGFIFLMVVAFFVLASSYVMGTLNPSYLGDVRLASTASAYGVNADPCDGKERCIVIYFATWCPACHASVPFVSGLQKYKLKPQGGLKIIVGGGSHSEQAEMARKIGGLVFFDSDGKFNSKLGSFSVPHKWLVDKNGKVLKEAGGLVGGDFDEARKSWLQGWLGNQAVYFF